MISTDYYQKKLLKLKKELQAQNKSFKKQRQRSLKDSTSELSSYDNHIADLGGETFERSKDLGLKDNIDVLITKVDKALDKIDKNTYGVCDNCEKDIDEARLEAIPYAALCAICQEKYEKTNENRARPIEEEILSFESRLKDSGVEYDREDAWQDVENYGTSSTPQDEESGNYSYKQTYKKSEDIGIVENIDKLIDIEDEDNEKNENELG